MRGHARNSQNEALGRLQSDGPNDLSTAMRTACSLLWWKFYGLVGLADPIQPEVPEAVRECYCAGIRVGMITGDYPVTAQNIARQIGLTASERVLTGTEIEALDDQQLRKRVPVTNIFARVPEQKLRLVHALR